MFVITFMHLILYVLCNIVPALIAEGTYIPPLEQLSVLHYFLLFRILFRIIQAISIFPLCYYSSNSIRLCFTNMYTEFMKIELYFN